MSENKLNENVSTTEAISKARREARAKKILENAKIRLEKLSNGQVKKAGEIKKHETERVLIDDAQNNDDENKEDKFLKNFTYYKNISPDPEFKVQDKFPDPEMESELEFGPKLNLNIGSLQKKEHNQDFIWQGEQQPSNNPFGFNNDFVGQSMMFGNLNQPNQMNNQNPNLENLNDSNTNFNIIIKNKLHLIAISILTYIISRNANFTSFSVFLPLLIWELTETFLLKTTNTSNDILFSILLLFAGLSPKTSTSISKIVGVLNKIFKDVGVFVFFFVICHIITMSFF